MARTDHVARKLLSEADSREPEAKQLAVPTAKANPIRDPTHAASLLACVLQSPPFEALQIYRYTILSCLVHIDAGRSSLVAGTVGKGTTSVVPNQNLANLAALAAEVLANDQRRTTNDSLISNQSSPACSDHASAANAECSLGSLLRPLPAARQLPLPSSAPEKRQILGHAWE